MYVQYTEAELLISRLNPKQFDCQTKVGTSHRRHNNMIIIKDVWKEKNMKI